VATSTSPLDSGPVTDARSLMRSGSFGPAAQGFADNVRAAVGSPFTIQLLVACSTETVQKALEQVAADDLYILPVSYKGRSCHRVCWGLYGSEAGASSALPALPDYFRQNGATPKVVRTATLLR
jgi:septal ring-binding cell division protein DamX